MGSSRPHTAHIDAHKGRLSASHLTKKEGVYYYRRRLPGRPGTEVTLSLRTRSFREAEHLAEKLDAVFCRAMDTVPAPAELRTILREYLEDHLAADAEMRLTAPPGRSVYTDGTRINGDRDAVDVDHEIIALVLGDAREALANRNFASVAGIVDGIMHGHSLPEEQRNALSHGVLEANVKALEEILARVSGKAPLILVGDPPATPTATPVAKPPAALFSKVLPLYIQWAVTERGWRGQSLAQNKATFAMFVEVCGDLAVGTYTRRHLSDFYNTLLALPALYSKDKRWRGLTLAQIVEAAKDDPAKRLAMKTVARHFSALGGFFTYAKRHGYTEGDNPAHDFEFPKRGRANSKRKVWGGAALTKLFTHRSES